MGKYIITIAILTGILLAGCDKGGDDNPGEKSLVFDVVMPAASETFTSGDLVTVKGKGFINKDVIFFRVTTKATTEITADVMSVTSTEIKFQIPPELPEGDNAVYLSRDGKEQQLGKIKVTKPSVSINVQKV